VRIGIDLMSVSRFARIAAHPRYRAIIFTQAELAQAKDLGENRRTERLAGRFCAKEATCKVLGRGFLQGLRWRDIEVIGDRWGAPQVTLYGGALRAAEQAGLTDIVLSLTHQADLVVAVAAAAQISPRHHRKEPIMEHVIAAEQDRLTEIAQIAADLFSVSAAEVTAARSFIDELETDSLLAIDLLTKLENRYNICIPDSDVLRMVNLHGTYEVVAEHAGW
jgi:acyl carrier protein